jgi:hypothetical protein
MHSLNDEAVIAERKRLDGVLDDLQAQIQVARAKKNSLIPVASLFHEILLLIFELVIAASPEGKQDHMRISLTHVYQRWRAVALNSPSYWRKISISKGPHTAEMRKAFITRSGKASLEISVNEDYRVKDMEDFVRDMRKFRVVRRITSLSLNAKFHDSRLLQLLDKIQSSFQLEHLELNRGWFPLAPISKNKKPTFVSGLSSLRTLSVVVGYDSLNEPYPPPIAEWPLPSSLQHLELCNKYGGPRNPPSKARTPWAQLLRALEPLKNLRSLQVVNFIICDTEKNPGKICLPHLKRLHVFDDAGITTSAAFANCLVLPALECIHSTVSLQSPSGTGANITALHFFDSIFSLIHSADLFKPPRALTFELQDEYNLGLYQEMQSVFRLRALHAYPHQCFDTELAFEPGMLKSAPSSLQLEVNVPCLGVREDLEHLTTRLRNPNINFFAQDFSALTDSVQLLVVQCYVADLVPFSTILSMKELRCIVYIGATYGRRPDITLPPFDDLLGGSQHSGVHPLPQLRALRFEGIKFTADHAQTLSAILKARASAGLHQLRIMFVGCEFYANGKDDKMITDQLRPFAKVEVVQRKRD